MKHLTEEELIAHYYSEDGCKAEAQNHLQACKPCAQAYEELSKLLRSVHAPEVPLRSSEYGAQVWQSIQGSLRPYEPTRKRSFYRWSHSGPGESGNTLTPGLW
jgi:hypothetical protein